MSKIKESQIFLDKIEATEKNSNEGTAIFPTYHVKSIFVERGMSKDADYGILAVVHYPELNEFISVWGSERRIRRIVKIIREKYPHIQVVHFGYDGYVNRSW